MKKTLLIFIILQLFLHDLSAQKEPRKVTLQLPWLHQFQFAGYYIAKEKGYYKELGLDVTFKEMNKQVDITKDVVNGISDYSVGRSSIILDKMKGDNIVALFAIFQNSPLILLSLESSSIKTIDDLKHKNIMLTNDAISTVAIHAMLVSNGLNLNDITFQNHTYNLDDLINKKTDALGAYISNEPYSLEVKGIPYTIFNPKDYGFNFYDGILFTSQKELATHPTDVYNFYQASLKGWQYAFDNISETINIIYNKYNTQNKTLDALLYEAYSLKDLAYINGTMIGTLDEEKISEIAKIYSILGFARNTKMAFNDFIYNNKLLVFSHKEKEFLEKEKVVYLTQEFEPFYIQKNNTTKGIAIDIWENLAQAIGLNTQYEAVLSQKNMEDKLTQTKHAIKLQLSHEVIHDKDKIFTHAIKSYPFVIATRNDENFIASPSVLNNKKVGIVKNCIIGEKIRNSYPKINFTEVSNTQDALELLSKGKIDAVIDILPTLTYVIKANSFSNLKISGTTEYKFDLRYMADQNEKELIALLNKAIDTFNKEKIESIEQQYFQVLYASHSDYSLLYKIGIPLSICLILFGLYNYRLQQEIHKRKLTEEKLYKAATVDMLTQIYNRSHIDAMFKEHLLSTKRYKVPLSIIFFDIDGFKKINDTYGHNLADTVLVDLANLTKQSIRTTDYVGRWGGEEFLVVLPQTNIAHATIAAEHLKERIENFKFQIDQKVTCSFGVTQIQEDDTQNSAITRADNLMYYVKAHGKNGVKAG
ncbi:MAG: ABC transporter substrate-binding protein [Arcobacteraceae bacterium]